LFVNETVDENGHIIREYQDKLRKTILKESIISGGPARTYYVYDDLDNLILVIPPIPSNSLTPNSPVPNMDDYCYQYKYDERKRLVEKKLPGKEVEYYIYDKLDRIFLYQDGNLRNQNRWMFNKYDILSRNVITGITWHWHSSWDRESLQGYIYGASQFYETPDASAFLGYSNDLWPNMTISGEILSVAYYDDYFIPSGFDPAYDSYLNPDLSVFTDTDNWEYNTGRVTGSAVKVLDNTNTYQYTLNFYDKYGRVIQSVSQNHLGGYDRITNEYDFTGNILLTLHEHHIEGDAVVKEWYRYTYDNGNRITLVEHKLGESSDPWIIMSGMDYNELGEMVEKNLHSEDGGTSYWQSVDYKYNIRGWLTNINRASLGSDNMIIALDENMEAMMMISGVEIDTIFYKVTEVTGIKDENSYLKIEISDKKFVEIKNKETQAVVEERETSETEVIYLYDNDSDDAIDYGILKPLKGNSYKVSLSRMRIGESTTVMDVMNEINNFVQQQLPGQGVEESEQLDLIALHMQQFTLNSMGVDYVNEDGGDDLFGMDIFYNIGITDLGCQIQYNGNISSIAWKIKDDENKRGYGFQYDDLNRIMEGNYGERNNTNGDWDQNMGVYSMVVPLYDKNGNILFLSRFTSVDSDPALLDNLEYYYEGNKLKAVDDNEMLDYLGDFKDNDHNSNNGTIQEYFYDANDNMIEDKNKEITITYNHLNLPEVVSFPEYHGENKIVYLYDANGMKLSVEVYKEGVLTTDSPRDYIGNFIYNNADGLELILTEEGVIDFARVKYQYFIKDHLGNNRVMFTKTDGEIDVLQENHYYPFGMKFSGEFTNNSNKYLYNGKELQDDAFKIQQLPVPLFRHFDWYDYGARFYDAQLARFHTLDPLAENYSFQSPFVYAANNPIRFIDFMGMNAGEYITRNGKIIGDDGNNDENIHIVISQNNIETIKENDAAGKTTDLSDVSVVATTTGTELEESLDVLDRTKGFTEESSVVTPEGEVTRGETGTGSANADLPFVEGNDNTSIHSHPLETTAKSGYRADQVGPDDPDTFKNYKRNIIVGKFGAPETDVFGKDVPRKKGAAFYKRNVTTKQITNVTMTRKAIKKTLRKVKRK